MSLIGSNGWLQNGWNLHIEVHKQDDGTFKASCAHTKQEAIGANEAQAIRLLKDQTMESALKGQI